MKTFPREEVFTEGGLPEQSHRDHIAQLFIKHRASLYRYLTHLVRFDDAAELVQESCFRLLLHCESLKLESKAREFLFRAATKLARDHRQRRAAHETGPLLASDAREILEGSRDSAEPLVDEHTLTAIEQAIADLPAETRAVFVLHRFRNLTYPQIAQTMNLSSRTVAQKMAEAIEELGKVVKAVV